MFLFNDIYKDIDWWYWLVTAVLLSVGLIAGEASAFYAAMGLTAVQGVHFYLRDPRLSAFPVQVRIGYLGLLILAQWPPLYFIYWIQFAGTWAMVLFAYCPLARILSLMPWNREQPFTWQLVLETALRPPVNGNIMHGLPEKAAG